MTVQYRKYIKRGAMAVGSSLTVFMGVFGFVVGSAQSPVMNADQKIGVLGAETVVRHSVPPSSPMTQSAVKAVTPSAKPAQPGARARVWSVAELYVFPDSNPAMQAQIWAGPRPADAAVMTRLAAQPQSKWFGDWTANVQAEANAYVGAAAAAGKMPVLVAYNIPGRDCGSYSSGGADSAAAYNSWIQAMAAGIAGRPAIVILEPDALPQLTQCLSGLQQQERLSMLQTGITTLKTSANTVVYLDAGNPGWQPAAVMGPRLVQAGIAKADGFSLNVSNFYTTPELITYGTAISAGASGAHFVIDTSRNGNGILSPEAWCNPDGRALGASPTLSPNLGPLVDAALWVKAPGESDGACNGGPSAGTWWPEYALGLARRAGW